MHIKFLPAYNGDAIHIRYINSDKPINILIDGGTKQTYFTKGKKNQIIDGPLKLLINEIKEAKEKINLLILTHVDDDHIGGILRWFENDQDALGLIERVWFNSGKTIAKELNKTEVNIPEIQLAPVGTTATGIDQGVTFEKIIRAGKIWDEKIIKQGQSLFFEGLTVKILSPSVANLQELHDKWKTEAPGSMTAAATDYKLSLEHYLANLISDPDDAPHNGSSIAFIVVYKKKNLLFLADAHIQTIVDGLNHFEFNQDNPIDAEFVKLSHHGSNRNISEELLKIINSDEFIISTNGVRHGHPDKKGLAKIIKLKINPLLKFTYPDRIDDIFTPEDRNFKEFRAVTALDVINIE